MQLQGRELSFGLGGDDVKLLQEELIRLGFDIPQDETGRTFFGPKTKEVVLLFQEKYGLSSTGIVNNETATQINKVLSIPSSSSGPNVYVVTGHVTYTNGKPFAMGRVRAFDKDLRSEELLGTDTTNFEGTYKITYTKEAFRQAEKTNADLRMCVCNSQGRELMSSPILFNAGPQETINLVVNREKYDIPSEYEELVTELTPLLQGLSFSELTEDKDHQDISFLCNETKEPAIHITFLVLAHRFKEKTHLAEEIWYALLRQGLPTELQAILSAGEEAQRKAIEASIDRNIIPLYFRSEIDKTLESLKELVVESTVEQSTNVPSNIAAGPALLLPIIGTVIPEKEKQKKFLMAYINNNKGPIKDFWESLRNDSELKNSVDDLQFTLQIGTLTNNNFSLVKKLQRMRQNGEIDNLSDLARFDYTKWKAMILDELHNNNEMGFPPGAPGKNDEEKAANYARAIIHMVEDSFPTLFAVQQMMNERDDDNESLPEKDNIIKFIENNPQFNLKITRLGGYLSENPPALDNIPGPEDRQNVLRKIRTIQRLYKVAPRYGDMRELMKVGFESANSIALTGRNTFIAKYGESLGGEAKAKKIHENALRSHAMAISILAEYGPMSNALSMSVFNDHPPTSVDGVPEWSTLFGPLDLCQCSHCKSVLSPAAYLVDILHLLKSRPSKIGKDISVKDVLFYRRADIGEIDLTCENTNTPLPYVDLVNEILEDAVSPFAPFEDFVLDAALREDLNNQALTEALKNAFHPHLSPTALITVGTKASPGPLQRPWWLIDDEAFTYRVQNEEDDQLHVVARNRQTRVSAEEYAANPQYINSEAYKILRKSVFPWKLLPFDLWREEVNVYLDHLGIARYEIMKTFFPGSGEHATFLNDADIAKEYIGISLTEAGIIIGTITSDTDSASPGIWNLWGFEDVNLSIQNSIVDPSDSTKRITSGIWTDVSGTRVDVFLQQSGLKYAELLNLLGSYLVNPSVVSGDHSTRQIQIVSTDDENPHTCELNKLALDGIDEEAFIRIVRFVRLWHNLKWNMYDLDRSITALGSDHPQVLNDQFIVDLANIQRLHKKLNETIASLITWWGPLDNFDALHSVWNALYLEYNSDSGDPYIVPSLYDQIFKNRTITNPADPAFTDPKSLSGTLTDNAPTIFNSLGISADDFEFILDNPHIIPRVLGDSTQPDDTLTLKNLSLLYRHTRLAKALKLSVEEYLIALDLINNNPFISTTETILFADTVDKIRQSGFTIHETDYLLRHNISPSRSAAVAPSDVYTALILDEIRGALQEIAAENTLVVQDADGTTVSDSLIEIDPNNVTSDPDGALTTQKLALLDWRKDIIDQIIATLNGTITYEAGLTALDIILPNYSGGIIKVPLAALPDDFEFPSELRDVIGYDILTHELKASRILTPPERTLLQEVAVTAPTDFTEEVEELFALQDGLQGEIRFDTEVRRLQFTGVMTEARRDRLLVASADPDYQAAITSLFDKPRQFISRHMRAFSFNSTQQFSALYPNRFSSALDALPADIKFPKTIKDRIYLDTTVGGNTQLRFIGIMTENERDLLLSLSDPADPNHTEYRAAIEDLYNQADALTIEPPDVFLSISGPDNDIATMFDDHSMTPADRFLVVLKKLLPYLKQILGEQIVKQKIGEALGLDYALAEFLLTELINSTADPSRKSISEFVPTEPEFSAIVFSESNTNIKLTRTSFPAQFETFELLYKVAMIVSKLQIKSTRQITWLFDYGNDVGWLDLNTLPIRTLSTDHPPASLHQFIRLVDLFQVRERLPRGELALDEIFELQEDTPSSDFDVVLKKVSEYTTWNLDDLEYLASAEGFDVPNSFPSGFQDERLFLRLLDAFTIINRLKMSAEQCNELSQADLLDEIARSVKQSVRAKYDQTQWLTVARPLRDKLRDKQRAALVEYLVAHLKEPLPILESPHPPDLHEGSERPAVWELQQKLNASGISQRVEVNGSLDSQTRDAVIAFQQHHGLNGNGIVDHDTWAFLDDARRRFRNVNDLFMYYLIDVEMSSCMLTSRIKQALSSTQLYVQRCLLNLESDVAATIEDFKWNEWKWMKNYRVWEANRKVFLYPENWVEPELRDDKTPIFKELEGELMQSDLNNETAEEAYMNYLEKLDEIAYLQIVGMYHQIEKNEYDETIMDILHVFGRTYASPPTYFYRKRMDSAYWTAWEKVDLDIEGDTLLPVIWNRRLYLFWPTVMEKAEPVDMMMPETGENVEAEPKKYWELGLAWSEYSQGKWKNKKTSSSYIRIPPIYLPNPKYGKYPPYTPDQIRSWFVFRAGFVRNNDLSIFCFIDNLSGSGPRGHLRDALDSSKVMVGRFTFSGCNSDPQRYDFSFSMVIDPIYNVLDLFFLRAFNYNNNGGMGWSPSWQWCHGLYGHKLVLPQPLSRRGEGDVLASPRVHNLLVPHDGSPMVDHPLFFMPFTPRRIFFITSSLGYTRVGDVNECAICSGDPGITSIMSNAYYRELRTPVAAVGSYSPTNSVRFEHSLPVNPVEDIADRIVSSNTPIVPTIPSDGSTIVSLIERETLPGADRLLTGRSDSSRLVSLHPNTRLTALLTGDSSASANELFVTTDSTVIKYRHQYHFQIFYHPYVCDFVRELNRYGVKGILNREIQLNPTRTSSSLDFKDDYEPLPLEYNIPAVSEPYPEEDVDFTYPGAYSQYNWELFFHIPLMLADRLSKNQRFEEAQKWFHYIFNPTDSSTLPLPQRYWITKPFYNTTKADYKKERIENLLRLLAVGGDPVRFSELSDKEKEELKEIENTVTEWRKHPFKPHLIARMRNTAYQKTVVMKYLDNLIAWGDRLFSRDTIESINEAAQLYVLAADILGHRPEEVLGRGQPSVQTYNSLELKLGSFSNALVQAEELISPSSSFSSSFPFVGIGSYTNIVIGGENVNGNENIPRSPYVSATDLVVNENDEEPPVTLSTIMLFCVPKNDKLLEYWDIVSDRLFKIRHCMNIEGIVRQLALFEPPIDPALLVKAAAAGVDITTVLNDITGAMPHYKFRVLVQKASELCAEVKSLGSAILATLEKKDAEHLAMIRAEHESTLLSMIESVKTQLIDEASENKEALRKSRAIAITRYSQHANMVDGGIHTVPAEGNDVPFVLSNTSHTILEEEEGVKMIPHEKSELWNLSESRSREEVAHGLNIAAAIAHAVPNFNLEPFGIGATFGGSNIGSALSAGANIASTLASKYTFEATLKAKLVQAIMRAHDHSMQSNIAATEIMHIDKQIQVAQLRKEITEKELANHKRQIENAKEIEEIMRSKYTNQELYSWMVGQLSGLYFQSYQIAYEVAKRAESAFRFELGLTDSNFIQFGYWDNLKRGLLAGEKLYHDIQRMEVAYLDKNKREYEITKHFSLAMLDPVALTQLKQTGECFISLPEVLFDMDYPGHYMRRIKSVSLTIPCVTGPYVGVNCTLTLVKNSLRHNNTLNGGKYARIEEGDDPRFTDSNGAVQSIVTSSGQNDSGLFETNLNDERYLPFEWAGAISQWHLKLPTDFRQFDYDTIVTVVLHMLYTARPAGGLLEDQAKVELQETINEFLRAESQKGLALSFSLRHEFSTEWHRFLSQPSESQEGHRKMTITLDMDRFPFMVHDRTISITKIELLVKVRSDTEENFPSTHNESTLKLSLRSGPEAEEPPADGAEDIMALALWNGLLRGITSEGGEPGQWNLWAWFDSGGGVEELNKDAIEDIVIICHYTLG